MKPIHLALIGAAAAGVYFAVSGRDSKNPGTPPRTYTVRGVGNDGSADNFVKAWNPKAIVDKAVFDRAKAELLALNPAASNWKNGLVLRIPASWPPAPSEFQPSKGVLFDSDRSLLKQVGKASSPLNTSPYRPKV